MPVFAFCLTNLVDRTARKVIFTDVSNALRLLERDEWILLDKEPKMPVLAK